MFIIRKIDDKNIGIFDTSIMNKELVAAAKFTAKTQNDKVVLESSDLKIKYTFGFDECTVNEESFTNSADAVVALNAFVGNFRKGGVNPETPTDPMVVDTSTGTITPEKVFAGEVGFSQGVEIVGTYIEPTPDPNAVNTEDATANAGDILLGKTAYARGQKFTGTFMPQAASTKWQPHPDWWGIVQIFNDLKADGEPIRCIALFSNSSNSVVLNPVTFGNVGCSYFTSDGCSYENVTAAITHTWDRAQDKPCSLGYKTRYIIVYSENANVSVTINELDVLFSYIGNGSTITNTGTIAGSTSVANYILQAFHCEKDVTLPTIGNNAFTNCYSMQSFVMPNSVISIGNNAFNNNYSLWDVDWSINVVSIGTSAFGANYANRMFIAPNSLTTLSNNTFNNNNGLISVVFSNSITSVGASAFNNTRSLIHVGCQQGWVAPALNVSASEYIAPASLVTFFTNLGVAPTQRTLTFAQTVLDRLTPVEKAIATDKNYILNAA